MAVFENIRRLSYQLGITVILVAVEKVGLIDLVPVDLTVALGASPPVGHILLLGELGGVKIRILLFGNGRLEV